MRDSLAHRGPDEAGDYSDADISLAHRRLAIVDVPSGQQPFYSQDESVVLVFNGEIYNHPALKRTLSAQGHRYVSNSDTESIIHAYLEHGVDCLRHLDGMFAFVLYDKRNRTLFGARDRFGKKPLFYSRPVTHGEQTLVFASEIRSLLCHPAVRRDARLSRDGLCLYLLHDYVPGRHTMFENVLKLEPGHAFVADIGARRIERFSIWRYWDNPILEPPSSDVPEEEAAAEVVRLLGKAVEKRLMADVPLGVFLSGGIDSSAIVALLARIVPAERIATFSIGFKERSFDESEHARAVARHFGARHSERMFSANDCLAELPLISAHMDEPLADPSILPTSMLSRFARESVTVALGGDGGDELFAGYDPFAALKPARIYGRLVPHAVDEHVFKPLAQHLPASGKNMPLAFRVQRFLRGAKQPPGVRLPTWMGPLSAAQLSQLMPDVDEQTVIDAYLHRETAQYRSLSEAHADEIQSALAYYQNFYLADDILVKTDRASMMHSLEVRAPFLDTELAEFVNGLPSSLKFGRGTRKYLLKRALTRGDNGNSLLPRAIVDRPKKGFGIPVAHWIRHELQDEIRAKIVADWPACLDMLDRRKIEELFTSHVRGQANNYKELWALFVLAEWAGHWVA
jgi:asparagine synthase (glutamine-hydrolysing)